MIATYGQVIPMHEEITHLAWPKRAGYAIAKVDDAIDGAMLDVAKNGFDAAKVRTVSENAQTLKFDQSGFEVE